VALRESAHSLKSSSANLEVALLTTLGKELEQRGREQRLEGTAERLAAVETRYPRGRELLKMAIGKEV